MPKLGVTLAGDLPLGSGLGGVVMAAGYDLGWFASELGEDYLCSKFLRKEWSLEVAERDIVQRIRDCRADDRTGFGDRSETRKWVAVVRDIRAGSILNEEELRDAVYGVGVDIACDFTPGYGYDLGSAGWLCAAQQRFRELWLARAEEAA